MPVTTPPAIIERIDSVLAAGNADNAASVQANFTADATIVDENSPFVWKGPQAGARWWRSIDRRSAMHGGGTLHVTRSAIAQSALDREGDDAYVIVPLRVEVTSNGKTESERGEWVLTLHRDGEVWMISTATWATTF